MSDRSTGGWTRRSFIVAGGLGLSACTSMTPQAQSNSRRNAIDSAVAQARSQLDSLPGAAELSRQAFGILIIPNIRQAALFAGGAYGEGALIIGPATVDYYALSQASIGFSFGAAAFNQALFFMTTQALQDFRTADGWQLGVGGQVVGGDTGVSAGVTTTRANRPIEELVFGQRGLIADVSFAGAKYNRISP